MWKRFVGAWTECDINDVNSFIDNRQLEKTASLKVLQTVTMSQNSPVYRFIYSDIYDRNLIKLIKELM